MPLRGDAVPYQFVTHDRYVEVHLIGVLERPERLRPEELDELLRLRAVLYDYTDVEAIRTDPWATAGAVREVAARGIRIAACTPRLDFFGIARQAAQMADIEGPAFGIFRTRDEAVAWLVSRCGGESA